MSRINVAVPEIGDFKNVPVIEILVKAGDHVRKGAPLVVLESDKAKLDVPSPERGTVGELKTVRSDIQSKQHRAHANRRRKPPPSWD